MDVFSYMLAPIENMTDSAFRALSYNNGADLTFTEMTSIDALAQKNENALLKIKIKDNVPTVIQLIGSKEASLKKFLDNFVPEDGFRGFNLNLGCPNPNIVGKGNGCALIKRISKVKRLIEMIKSKGYPVSIKMRLGMNKFEKENKIYLNLIREADADFFIVHARHGIETYDDKADFSVYKECTNTGRTIIANGDIKTKEQIDFLINCGIKGAMIGRAAIENPVIFNRLKGKECKSIDEIKKEYLELCKRHNSLPRYSNNIMKHLGK